LSAAACGEMVFDLVSELGVPLTYEIALHVYIAILTDTGSFHYSNITPRTFDICRLCMEAGVSPPAVARSIFDANNLGRLKLFGAVLNRMHLDPTGRIATLSVDKQLTNDCGGTYEDTEGLINLPLTVKEILAVVFFKGNIDINAIAKEFGGGGHKNASGCSANGDLETLQAVFEQKITTAIERA
jgi:phosphoesterase RecJ-like protein